MLLISSEFYPLPRVLSPTTSHSWLFQFQFKCQLLREKISLPPPMFNVSKQPFKYLIGGYFMINLLELVSLTVISLRAGPGFFVCFVLFCFAYSKQRNEGVKWGQARLWQSCSSGCCPHRDSSTPLKKIREGYLECGLFLDIFILEFHWERNWQMLWKNPGLYSAVHTH